MKTPVDGAFQLPPGDPSVLGGTYDPDRDAVNFSFYSKSAAYFAEDDPSGKTGAYVCVYDKAGEKCLGTFRLNSPGTETENPDEEGYWHGTLGKEDLKNLGVEDVRDFTYCYRVHGPYDPQNGHRFNVYKALIEPKPADLTGIDKFEDALQNGRQELFGYKMDTNPERNEKNANDPKLMDRTDSGDVIPKARVWLPEDSQAVPDTRPQIPWAETVIREGHVKSETVQYPDVPGEHKGKISGMSYMLDYLKKICTTIEFLPLHWAPDDGKNFWNYNTASFFLVNPKYGTKADLKEFVRKAHEKGVEVIMDVVFNHSAEGNHRGPTFCFRGADNFEYYALKSMDPRYYLNYTGCGNMLDLSNPAMKRLAIESLEYFAENLGVDGFRYDLAKALGRVEEFGYNYSDNAPFFEKIKKHPVLSQRKHTGEPWDCGDGGKPLLPKFMLAWNGYYSEVVRKFWRQDEGIRSMARVVSGSHAFFKVMGERFKSVSYVFSHDGQSAADNVAYEGKYNKANGEDNADGSHIIAGNGGAEGPTDDPKINRYRLRTVFNMLTTLFSSFGPIMYKAGDEMGHTQQGNNNPYCQDNPISWMTWQWLNADNTVREDENQIFTNEQKRKILAFVHVLSAMRNSLAPMKNPFYPHGEEIKGIRLEGQKLPYRDAHGLTDLTWWNPNGHRMNGKYWSEDVHSYGQLFNNAAMPKEMREKIGHDIPGINETSRVLVINNAHNDDITYELPQLDGARGDWREIINTDGFAKIKHNAGYIRDAVFREGELEEGFTESGKFVVPAQSSVVLVQDSEVPAADPRARTAPPELS